MSYKKIVIIGGVAGGASAAVRARRIDEQAEIIVLDRGNYVSFANCGLPYRIGDVVPRREQLIVKKPDDFKQRFNIDVRVRHEVTAIDRTAKTLQIFCHDTAKNYVLNYDYLVLSPGAAPRQLPNVSTDMAGVYTLRTLEDMDRIMAQLAHRPCLHATVVGAGFIGLEVIEALTHRNIKTSLIELGMQVMPSVDSEMAQPIYQLLIDQGVDVHLNTKIDAIEEQEGRRSLYLSNGQTLQTDMIILAIGVVPETKLAQQAGLDLGARGGIKVDQHMRSSDPFIYAVGDAVETPEWVSGQSMMLPLAGPANRQGRIAINHMYGVGSEIYRGSQAAAICGLFGFAIGHVGLNERHLKQLQRVYQKVYVHIANKPSYMPGSSMNTLKLLFDPEDGKILGAQACGLNSIDKCIDTLSTAQHAGLSVRDLEYIEVAYAPPFNNARDIVNQAGMLATNVLDGFTKICHAEDVLAINLVKQCILDVRDKDELINFGEYPNAMHIPVDQLRERLSDLPIDKEIIIACQSGLRGHVAYRLLTQHGFNARNLSGGYKTYQAVVKSSHH